MLRNLHQIEGKPLQARDGIIGEVKDVYFDDHHWHVRYLVVETGAWLKKRKVLIAPEAFHGLDWGLQVFPVDLTTAQVRSSPGIDTDQPVSRQHEESLRRYYGWPMYWDPMFGPGELATPIFTPVLRPADAERDLTDGTAPLRRRDDPHLRSANDTVNYHIETSDGAIGHVHDFLIDEAAWNIRYLIVDTRNWLPGRKVLLAPAWIRNVSWTNRSVVVDLTREAVKGSPPYDAAMPLNSAYAAELHDYYGRPRYSDWDRDIVAGSPRTGRPADAPPTSP
jgi:hypothetical protein